MSSRAWNARLTAWRTMGYASPLAHLLDRALARAPHLTAALDVNATTDTMPAIPDLTVEIERDGRHHSIRATQVRAVISHVHWLTSPTGVHLGLVNNAPIRAVYPGADGDAALLIRSIDDDLLVPFQRLQLRRKARA
ncbi:MAG: hypothetical protein SFX73_13420 [Kofleriaceae bacterium]|nr:hypothetical protein [Kofleriaceae bacterium]